MPQSGNSKIVFGSNREGSMQIYVMNGDGSGVTRLTYSGANDDYPRWSPNGNKILFQSDRDNPFSGIYDIYVMNADGSAVTRLTTDGNDDRMASWSPDGTKIVFQSLRNGAVYQVYSMNADGSGQVNLTNTSANDIEPSWSPNGAKIAFASDRDHTGTSSVYVMNSNGTGQQRLTLGSAPFDDRQPAWSRDGAKIAFVSTRDSVTETWMETDDYEIPEDDGQTFSRSLLRINKEIYLMNADGSGQTRLTTDSANDDAPSWSPDGTKIIFYSNRERDGSDPIAQVWTMNVDGSAQTDLSNDQLGNYRANWNTGSFNQSPVANAGGTYSGGTGQNVSFNGASSYDPDGSIVSYSWNFGDGATGSGAAPTHTYNATGTYNITLTVIDNLGAQATASTNANIAGPTVDELAAARLDPFNQTGNQMMARDCEWGISLVSLPGRSGLDLGIGLSYSSLVWTRTGSFMSFDDDHGDPSPGFRIGFPTIGGVFYDTQAGVNARMMITSSGRRVELRRVGNYGSYDLYQANDSSYLQLIDYSISGGSIWLRTTDGMNLGFAPSGGEWHCTTIRDRNGNVISAAYNGSGDITSVTDTLGRVLYFNYDTYGNLNAISQNWNGWWRDWATFGWANQTLHPNFALTTVGASEGEVIPVLAQVGLPDGSHYNFEYTDRGQVNKIVRYTADGAAGIPGDLERSSVTYTYESPTDDCPRISASHVTAENWQSNVQTTFEDLGSGWHRMTMPDGTQHTELYQTSGWQRGLTSVSEVWSGGVRQKWTTIDYTQDNTGVSYQLNPRVIETNVYDANGNRRRVTVDYSPPQYAQYGLPYYVSEYANDGTTELRRTYTDYNLSQQYLDWHIIGLVSAVHVADLSNGWQWKSKTVYGYDGVAVDAQATTATQHDQYFSSSFNVRGNLTSVSRWDVTDIGNNAKALTTQMTYNAAGSMLSTTDPLTHVSSLGYADSFSDGNNSRGTFAYPTTLTDADGYSSYIKYNFDFGAVTQKQTPLPNTTANTPGLVTTFAYDEVTRLHQVTVNTGAYVHYDYGPNHISSFTSVNSVAANYWESDSYTNRFFDGLGRVFAVASNHPGSTGGNKGQYTRYDQMGRAVQQTNPFEMDSGWNPTGDDAAGYQFNWPNTFDWKGRPLRTYNMDGTYKEASYAGCGCAGGEVTSATDEAGRQRRTTADGLGRLVKTEEMNWEVNGTRSVYSTANYAYNALDQLTSINHEGQVRSFSYDGYGRLQTRTTPEQGATTYSYFNDGTIQTVTDARGATATYGYNNRHLPISINYNDVAGVAATPNVSFGYDAAGNRTSMSDGVGNMTYHYDQLSRMDWEQRTLSVGTYRLTYSYNYANELTGITNPWGIWNGYSYDNNGRLNRVHGDGQIQNVTTYAYDIKYRAFDGVKSWSGRGNTSFAATYDNRMRPTSSNTGNRIGYNYSYLEGTGRVNYAQNIANGSAPSNGAADPTLDRGYEYDQVGALVFAHSGAEARAQFGINGQQWGQMDGPYSLGFDYDPYGNMTLRYGWGGEVQGGTAGQTSFKPYSYSNGKNQCDGFTYDPAGNLTNDQAYSYLYDATGQQRTASTYNYFMSQGYDGDGLRGSKTENGTTTYYLRSTVFGGAVVAEIDGNGGWQRGYVYAGGELMAVQQGWQLYWVHEDSVTKSKQITDVYGNVVSTVELDPWGANTNRSSNSAFLPQSFTSYIRDANGGQDAMARRYLVGGRFSQPDPYGGSYKFADPQSLNRYAYVGNDPVNRRDPSGLVCIEIWVTPTHYISLCNGFGDDHRPEPFTIVRETREELGGGPGHGTASQKPTQFKDQYIRCSEQAGGPVPPRTAVATIRLVSQLEGVDPTLLAVTWGSEAIPAFSFNSVGNVRKKNGKAVGADVGPGQIANNGVFTKSPWTDGLTNPFGTFTTQSVPFDGNPLDNLRLSARILNSYGGGRTAAGLYHSGTGDFSKTAGGIKAFNDRARQYDQLQPSYSNFFGCMNR